MSLECCPQLDLSDEVGMTLECYPELLPLGRSKDVLGMLSLLFPVG